jgi:hypothetical protein
MSQPNDEATIKDLVRRLFLAENRQDAEDADRILASDYLPITRARGQVDQSRKQTLKNIAAGSPLFMRHVDQVVIEVTFFPDNNRMAIARSLLPTTDARATPPAEASYRNINVFLKREDKWQCVAWQVTQVQETR